MCFYFRYILCLDIREYGGEINHSLQILGPLSTSAVSVTNRVPNNTFYFSICPRRRYSGGEENRNVKLNGRN